MPYTIWVKRIITRFYINPVQIRKVKILINFHAKFRY